MKMKTIKDDWFELEVDVDAYKSLYEWEDLKESKFIAQGVYEERRFMIRKCCMNYPVVYVEGREGEENMRDYYGEAYWLPEDKRDGTMYHGWDHGHMDDYDVDWVHRHGMVHHGKNHKWSIYEMLMEIGEFIGMLYMR